MKSIIKTDRLELKTPELYMAHEVFNWRCVKLKLKFSSKNFKKVC